MVVMVLLPFLCGVFVAGDKSQQKVVAIFSSRYDSLGLFSATKQDEGGVVRKKWPSNTQISDATTSS